MEKHSLNIQTNSIFHLKNKQTNKKHVWENNRSSVKDDRSLILGWNYLFKIVRDYVHHIM